MAVKILCWLVLAVNLIAFLLCGWDKLRARRQGWRVPERVLLGWAAALGSLGMLLGMVLFCHKVHKPKFRYGVPALVLVHILLAVGLACWALGGGA